MSDTATIIAAKSISSGGLSMLILSVFNDVEFVLLLSTGIFASFMSFIYDITHDETGRKLFTFKEMMTLFRYVFYGIPVMFTVYYVGVLHMGAFITLPVMVWGLVGMLAAGSAISIVEFIAPLIGNTLSIVLNKKVGK